MFDVFRGIVLGRAYFRDDVIWQKLMWDMADAMPQTDEIPFPSEGKVDL